MTALRETLRIEMRTRNSSDSGTHDMTERLCLDIVEKHFTIV